jgi:hypothetical protein
MVALEVGVGVVVGVVGVQPEEVGVVGVGVLLWVLLHVRAPVSASPVRRHISGWTAARMPTRDRFSGLATRSRRQRRCAVVSASLVTLTWRRRGRRRRRPSLRRSD